MTTFESFEAATAANAKGTDLVKETCSRCMGNGNVGYGNVNSTHYLTGAQTGSCFDCIGTGFVTVRVSSIKARIRREAKRQAEAAAREIAAQDAQAKRTEWDATHPAEVAMIEALADTTNERGIAYDLLNSRTAIPTDAQLAKLAEMKAEKDAREAARTNIITGKGIQVEGEIISAKAHETHFGYRTQYSTKIVVRDDRGFKVRGTLPTAVASDLHAKFIEAKEAEGYSRYDFGPDCWLDSIRGLRIRFTANIEASDRDDSFDFGFFKLPRRVEVL